MQIDYTKFVASITKPGEEILATLTPAKVHLWHMSSCICGEAAEVLEGSDNKDNLIEELGDIEFYLEGYRQISGITREESEAIENEPIDTFQDRLSFQGRLSALVVASGMLFDVTKRHILYERKFNRDLTVRAISLLEFALDQIHRYIGVTRLEVVAANIAKLRLRYPEGYSNAAAQARADKTPANT